MIDADADPYVASDLGTEMADRVGATVLTLVGQGHWWMTAAPDEAADGLVSFWNGLG